MVNRAAQTNYHNRTTILYGIGQLTIGGAERQLYELAVGLNVNKFRPLVFTTSVGGVYGRLLREREIPVYVFPRRNRFDLLPVWKIASLIRNETVGILHTFGYYAGIYGRLATLFVRPRLVISSERATRAQIKSLNNRPYIALDRLLDARTDIYVANAKAVKQFAVKERGLPEHKFRVIYNGLDTNRFSQLDASKAHAFRRLLGIDRRDQVVGILARLVPIKDHYTFLRCAQLVLHALPKTKFILLGDGPLKQKLQGLVSELELGKAVIFAGERTGNELTYGLALMDVFVLSSKEEGCSNVILEAMAMAKPVVATDVGGNGELVINGETGILVPAGDAHLLACAVERLLIDEELRRTMGRNGKMRLVANFSVEKLVQKSERLYAEESTGHQRSVKDRR